MRIGINANYFQKPSTGIGVVTSEFMRSLAVTAEGRTHEWIWYYEGDAPAGKWPENWSFQKVSTWWSRDDVPHRYLWERFSLSRAIARDQCEVFFSLYQSATVLPESVHHVMLVHDLIPKRFPEYLRNVRQCFHYRAIQKGIQSATRLLTPSQATKHDLESLLGIPRAKIAVVPLGIGHAFREPIAPAVRDSILARFGLSSGYLYHGGGLELRKNTALLLRAYAKVMHSSDAALLPPLVISGTLHAEDNPLATPVRTLVKELGLESAVRLLGWVPDADLPALYQGALAFVYPSRYEGFGLPVLEAFASGTPVISTAAGSLAELVSDAALVISPDDCDGLARVLLSISTDTNLRDRLREQGRVRAAGYDWSRFTASVASGLLQ
jgi:alpha-1,3-rhamnosyl/mannosyltransferase